MNYNSLPNTELDVSSIGLGSWVFGGKFWGGANDQDSIQAIHCAQEQGINLIDTAPVYGFGKAEEVIGYALQGRRDKWIVATKCGLVLRGPRVIHSLKPESIRQEVEASLKRLRMDYIDLYQCHWPDPATPFAESLAALRDLQVEGKIRYIGVCNFSVELLRSVSLEEKIVTQQEQLSLLERKTQSERLGYARESKKGFLAYGALAGGILSGKYAQVPQFSGSDVRQFFYPHYAGDVFTNVQAFLGALKSLNRPLAQVAINWVRQQSGVTSVLVGCRKPAQLVHNLESLRWELTDQELVWIEDQCREFFHG